MSQLNKELFDALRHDNVRSAKESVNKGAMLTSVDGNGHTVLHEAACAGSINVINWLIRECQNSDINKVDEDGNTPFHTAAFEGQITALKTLYEYNNSGITITNNANDTVSNILKEWYPDVVTEWEQFLKAKESRLKNINTVDNTENSCSFLEESSVTKFIDFKIQMSITIFVFTHTSCILYTWVPLVTTLTVVIRLNNTLSFIYNSHCK